jgi:hypothetical protein
MVGLPEKFCGISRMPLGEKREGKSLFQTLNSYRFGGLNPEVEIPVVHTLNYYIPV